MCVCVCIHVPHTQRDIHMYVDSHKDVYTYV